MNWFNRLKNGLAKSSANLTENITKVFTTRKLDSNKLDELEEMLIEADIGIRVANKIITQLGSTKFNKEISDIEVKEFFAHHIENIIKPISKPLVINQPLHVILFCGVNGNGKTTTIGKIAHKLTNSGKKVVLAACDTFRAAADAQLKVWAERAGAKMISGEEGADPASVAYRAYEVAVEDGADVLLIDTAGRLQNKAQLMEELAKTIRILKKHNPDAPHNILLVLDATTGQNAISQVENFRNYVNLTGLIVTKLDGTARAGIMIAITEKFAFPIHMIGVGEGIEDLNEFNPKDFCRNLFGI